MIDRASLRRNAAAWGVLAVGCVVYVALAHFFADQRGDDSFIYDRVADNVLAGHGPVFNAGDHVECMSSPAWLAVLVAARGLGVGYIVFSRFAGILLVAAGVAVGARLARELGATRMGQAMVVLACALTGSLHYWAPSGLETPLCVLTMGVLLLAIARGNVAWWAAATALLGVLRPEGPAMVIASAVAMVVAHGRRSLGPWPVAAAFGPAVGYEIFRLAYYGPIFPNTYYAKATGPLADRLGLGLEYGCWMLVGLAVACAVVGRGLWVAWRARCPPSLALRVRTAILLLLGALAFVVVGGGGDWMWGHRLSLPIFPPLFALLAATFTGRAGGQRRRASLLAVTMFVMINDDLPWHDRLEEASWFGLKARKQILADPGKALSYRFVRPLGTIADALAGRRMAPTDRVEGTMTEASRDVAAWIVAHSTPDTLIAVNHAGAVPFYTRLPTVDMTGLADRHIARVVGGLHEKYDPTYVLRRRPHWIVLNSRVQPGLDGVWYHEGYWEGETALVHAPEFTAHYRAVPRYWRWDYSDHRGNFILLYERIN